MSDMKDTLYLFLCQPKFKGGPHMKGIIKVFVWTLGIKFNKCKA